MSDDYSAVALLAEFDAIGMKVKHVAALAAVSESQLNRAKNGFIVLPGQDLVRMRHLLAECKVLAARNTLPINWTDMISVREALNELRAEKKSPPGPLSSDEANLLHRFATADDIEFLAINCGLSRATLLEKVEELLSRSGRLVQAARI
jgi:hypothetical protein